jgi:hypothetical protein
MPHTLRDDTDTHDHTLFTSPDSPDGSSRRSPRAAIWCVRPFWRCATSRTARLTCAAGAYVAVLRRGASFSGLFRTGPVDRLRVTSTNSRKVYRAARQGGIAEEVSKRLAIVWGTVLASIRCAPGRYRISAAASSHTPTNSAAATVTLNRPGESGHAP